MARGKYAARAAMARAETAQKLLEITTDRLADARHLTRANHDAAAKLEVANKRIVELERQLSEADGPNAHQLAKCMDELAEQKDLWLGRQRRLKKVVLRLLRLTYGQSRFSIDEYAQIADDLGLGSASHLISRTIKLPHHQENRPLGSAPRGQYSEEDAVAQLLDKCLDWTYSEPDDRPDIRPSIFAWAEAVLSPDEWEHLTRKEEIARRLSGWDRHTVSVAGASSSGVRP